MFTPMRSFSPLSGERSGWLETQRPATATRSGVRRRTPEQQPMRQTSGAAGAAAGLTGLYRAVQRCALTTRHSASSNVVSNRGGLQFEVVIPPGGAALGFTVMPDDAGAKFHMACDIRRI